MCWNSLDSLSKYILSGSKCFCKVAITTSRDISPALVVLSTQPAVQVCGFADGFRNAFAVNSSELLSKNRILLFYNLPH